MPSRSRIEPRLARSESKPSQPCSLYLAAPHPLRAADHARRGAGLLHAGAPRAGRPAGVDPAAGRLGRPAGAAARRCTASTAAARAVRDAGSGARCTATSAPRSPPAGRSPARCCTAVGNTLRLAVLATLHRLRASAACSASSPATSATRWIDRAASMLVGARRQRAALLARHGAGDRLLGRS